MSLQLFVPQLGDQLWVGGSLRGVELLLLSHPPCPWCRQDYHCVPVKSGPVPVFPLQIRAELQQVLFVDFTFVDLGDPMSPVIPNALCQCL